MAIIGNFNGASIVALPTSPGLKSLKLVNVDAVSKSVSPFTGTTQVQAWPGGDYWMGSFELPRMTANQAAVWSAWQMELRGMLNVFALGDPLYKHPAGVAKGTPVINGVHAAMATSINTKGWQVNTYRQLLPGDYLQIGYRLHRVLDQANSDASGNSSLAIWPSLREALTDGTPIILREPKGLFRLTSNSRSMLSDETRLHAIGTIAFIEAR